MKSRYEIVQPVIEAELAKVYSYGVSDCFFLGCRVADTLSGTSMCETYKGRYRTLAGAQRTLRREGHTSLVTFFSAHLEPCAPAAARLGDIAIIQLGDAEHVGVCVGSKFLTKTETGASFHDVSRVKAAFLAG
ncbi:DUF6950 family protein [Limoniibacter endophyticus]|nr:hypothetical protein [Limoniibacter endophyticus]